MHSVSEQETWNYTLNHMKCPFFFTGEKQININSFTGVHPLVIVVASGMGPITPLENRDERKLTAPNVTFFALLEFVPYA